MNKNLFGVWITYTHEITKSWHYEKNIRVTEHPAIRFTSKPAKALLIGDRHLQNGRTSYGGLMDEYGDQGGDFNVTSVTHCLVVVEHPKRNPIRVAIDGAKLLNGLLVKDLL